MKKAVYLLLGSNLGNRQDNLRTAIARLTSNDVEVVRCSSIYSSKAWGIEDQPDFLNQVIEIRTELSPEDLLYLILDIEVQAGRSRGIKWGPRVLDIDILFYADLVLESWNLVIPHPGIPNRRFTLVPLAEICPKMVHPVLNVTIEHLLEACEDEGQPVIEETSASR